MSGQLVGVAVTQESSTQLFPLGTLHIDNLGNHYRYMLAGGALTAYLLYVYDHDVWTSSDALTTTVAASTEVHPLICPQIAVTSAYYFWAFVGPGRAYFTSAAGITAQKKLYTTATDGKIDDNSSSTVLIPALIAYDAFASATTGICKANCEMYISN